MSNRTQEEGRTPYTEHDFNYTPSARIDDRYRTDIDWQEKLLWAIRKGDPTFDISVREGNEPLIAPVILLTAPQSQRIAYGSNSDWLLAGSISNFDTAVVYSDMVFTVGDRGDAAVTPNADGTIELKASGSPFANNLLSSIPVKATVTATRNGKIETGNADTVIPFEFYVSQPVLATGTPDKTSVEVGLPGEDVKVSFNVFNTGPEKFHSGRVEVSNNGTVKVIDILTMPADNMVTIPNNNFGPGKNTVSVYAKSTYNNELSVESGKTLDQSVTGLIRPDAPSVTVDGPKTIEVGDANVVLTGTVNEYAGKMVNATLNATVTTGTFTNRNYSVTIPTATLAEGTHTVTVKATTIADLESPEGEVQTTIIVTPLVVTAPSMIQTPIVPVKEGEDSTIWFALDLSDGTTLKSVVVTFDGKEYTPVVDGNAGQFRVVLPTSTLIAGEYPYTVTAIATRKGKDSLPGILSSNVVINVA